MANSPERRFGPGAARLAGLAARMFGWLPDQFWLATPAELAAALSPYRDESGEPVFGAAIHARPSPTTSPAHPHE